MREQHFTFPSWNGSNEIHAVHWIPDGEIRMVVQISHGMSEHIRRYRVFAEHLCRYGILVCGHDHLGHGDSVANADGYGFFSEKDGNRALVHDLHRLTELTKKKISGCPLCSDGTQHGLCFWHVSMCAAMAQSWMGRLSARQAIIRQESFVLRLHFAGGWQQ